MNGLNHSLTHLGEEEKMPYLVGLLRENANQNAVVFCNTPNQGQVVSKWLTNLGFKVKGVFDRLEDHEREALSEEMQKREVAIIVTTDQGARSVPQTGPFGLVVNYNLPRYPENYMQRVNKAASVGKAISFCAFEDCPNLDAIEELIRYKIPTEEVNEAKLVQDIGEKPQVEMSPRSPRDGNFRNDRGGRNDRGPKRNDRNDRGPRDNARNDRGSRDMRGGRNDRNDRGAAPRNDRFDRPRRNDPRPARNYGDEDSIGNQIEGSKSSAVVQMEENKPSPRRQTVVTANSLEKAQEIAMKNLYLDDVSLLDHKILEEGKRSFLGLMGPKEITYEFSIKPEYAKIATKYLQEIFKFGGFEVDAIVEFSDPVLKIKIAGNDDELLAGNEGEVLASIDHVLTKHLGKIVPIRKSFRIEFECAGFVDPKIARLHDLAQKMKERALREKHPVILKPMNPAERRIIHQYLDKDTEVKTFSLGEGHLKRIKIDLVGESQSENKQE